ncbi:MAG: TetR/AcrR family transcriptional regulator [Lachnospiraceae bacterium]|nr:TetR/AcrR family transcriptional regulator [Lachnospiraceae bacterium]MBR4059948.1 TetR/AcrR family transcriptional regulator [Lachnospiraceae bacterium]
MNQRFFSLPVEKQQAIINAGYRVFSQNSYKNSPMSEIADAAGISKALLFHYFHNKKELYLFLWDKCAETTIAYMTEYGCYGQTELFESMERGMRAKMEIIRRYPDMGTFTIKAFYVDIDQMEKDFTKLLTFWKSIYLRKE